jgi:hypothetical protein
MSQILRQLRNLIEGNDPDAPRDDTVRRFKAGWDVWWETATMGGKELILVKRRPGPGEPEQVLARIPAQAQRLARYQVARYRAQVGLLGEKA